MIKIALCQTKVEENLNKNIENVCNKIKQAASCGAQIISLCEMFTCPYSGKFFSLFSEEEETGASIKKLKELSKKLGVYIIGGSIPEKCNGRIYNTSFIFDNQGQIIAKHRKIHLFDVDIKDGISFFESEFLNAGDNITVFDSIYGKIGVCICYDIRFPELIRTMALDGAKIIFVPAAFNMTTGPAHWETLFRARAIDNQIYIAGVSPARDYDGVYTAYGNSIVVNPWGEIISRADEKEQILYADIDFNYLESVRSQIPVYKHRKTNIYKL